MDIKKLIEINKRMEDIQERIVFVARLVFTSIVIILVCTFIILINL